MMKHILVILLFVAAAPKAQAQQHHPQNWYCVRQPWAETTDGNVVVRQCVAAVPKDDKLDADDEDILTKLDVIRYNAKTFHHLGQSGDEETMNAIRMGFGQMVGQLCQKHPKIVLAPLLLTSATTTLYSCKNIIAAPEK